MAKAPITRQQQQARTAKGPVRARLRSLLPLSASLLLLALAPAASAFSVVSEPGEGAGQTRVPNGLAVNFETGRLYVADRENKRIVVFDKDGAFVKAFGKAGEGAGQFSAPKSIAVDNSCFTHDPPLTEATSPTCAEFDPSYGDVYVVDTKAEHVENVDAYHHRVQKFDADGSFLLAFGGGVDEGPHHPGNLCTAAFIAAGDNCGAGSNGSGEGEFSSNGSGRETILVGVNPDGSVDVLDAIHSGGEYEHRLQRLSSSGVPIAPQQILLKEQLGVRALAVDSSGDFYVSNGEAVGVGIRKYGPDGALLY
jgi:DNA-binding beta-propeller fold protein YncE